MPHWLCLRARERREGLAWELVLGDLGTSRAVCVTCLIDFPRREGKGKLTWQHTARPPTPEHGHAAPQSPQKARGAATAMELAVLWRRGVRRVSRGTCCNKLIQGVATTLHGRAQQGRHVAPPWTAAHEPTALIMLCYKTLGRYYGLLAWLGRSRRPCTVARRTAGACGTRRDCAHLVHIGAFLSYNTYY